MRAQLSIARLAARQHGVVARRQLTDLGLDRGHIGRALAAGHLLRMHRGVYAVGHRAVADHGRWMAATLASEGVLSHRSAAALWGLPLNDNGLTRVTTPTNRRHARIDAHRADLHPRDRTVRRRIPVTTVARTLADLAHSLDDATYHRAVKEAQFKGLFDEAKVQDALARRPAQRLKDYVGDGYEAHGTRVAFQDDRTATNALQLGGFVVLRYTHDDVTRRGRLIAAQVLSAGNFSSTHCGPSSARR
jgi:predicted transcriptional regulator of viral defense system